MRPFDDKYAKLAMTFRAKIAKRVDRFEIAPTLWDLANYLESVDKGKHEQHLIMLGTQWLKQLPSR